MPNLKNGAYKFEDYTAENHSFEDTFINAEEFNTMLSGYNHFVLAFTDDTSPIDMYLHFDEAKIDATGADSLVLKNPYTETRVYFIDGITFDRAEDGTPQYSFGCTNCAGQLFPLPFFTLRCYKEMI